VWKQHFNNLKSPFGKIQIIGSAKNNNKTFNFQGMRFPAVEKTDGARDEHRHRPKNNRKETKSCPN
jgi:hypothetical protein